LSGLAKQMQLPHWLIPAALSFFYISVGKLLLLLLLYWEIVILVSLSEISAVLWAEKLEQAMW